MAPLPPARGPVTTGDSDERLHELLRAGEIGAFDALYQRYERRLLAFVRAHVGDTAEAEDVLHETFLALLDSRPDQRGEGSLRGWLYRVARNHALNRMRGRERGGRAGVAASLIAESPAPLEEALAGREAGRALTVAVARLPATLAEVYALRAAGLSYEEMSQVLALPLGTVKSRIHAMVKQLKQEMTPWTAP